MYSGAFGMDAGGDQGESCASTVELRYGVDFGTGVEKEVDDFCDVGGSFLAVVFDAVGCDIVQERGLMAAGGVGAGQVGIFFQQIGE